MFLVVLIKALISNVHWNLKPIFHSACHVPSHLPQFALAIKSAEMVFTIYVFCQESYFTKTMPTQRYRAQSRLSSCSIFSIVCKCKINKKKDLEDVLILLRLQRIEFLLFQIFELQPVGNSASGSVGFLRRSDQL